MSVSLLNTSAYAASDRELLTVCDSTLNAAGEVITKQDEQIKVCELGIDVLKSDNQRLYKDLAEIREPSIWRNPWLYAILGFAAGVALTK